MNSSNSWNDNDYIRIPKEIFINLFYLTEFLNSAESNRFLDSDTKSKCEEASLEIHDIIYR